MLNNISRRCRIWLLKMQFAPKFFMRTEGTVREKIFRTKSFSQQYAIHKWNQLHPTKINVWQGKNQISGKMFQNLSKYFSRGKVMADSADTEGLIKRILKKAMHFLSIYYESVQNLVEGRRQVMQDEDFCFQDGESVKQKKQRFQAWFSRISYRKTENEENKTSNQNLQDQQQKS